MYCFAVAVSRGKICNERSMKSINMLFIGDTGRLVLKKLFFCVGEYAEYGFDQQSLIWHVRRVWDMVFS